MSAPVAPATPAVVTAMQPVSTPAAKPVIGDFGLDLSAGNKSVKPGDDFFAYASGSWDETFQIPAGQVQLRALRPSRRTLQGAGAQDRRALGGGQGRHRHPGAADRRLLRGVHGRGRHRGPRPRPRRGRSWTASAPPRHARTSRACSARSASRRCSTSICNPDFKNPNRYAIFISQSSLGLPDRDYYLKDDPKLKALREKYVAYVAQMLTLGGSADPHGQARDIMAFETAVAKAQWPIEKRRDVEATYNPRTKQQLLSLRARVSRGRRFSRRSSSARVRTWCSAS